MELFDILERRRSARAYRQAIPDAAIIESILEAARRAPSAGNLQAYHIVVVARPDLRKALTEAAHGQPMLEQAPTIIVFFADPERSAAKYGKRGRSLFAIQDATIAAAYAQLAATALGLASCWVGAFDEEAVARALNAPEQLRPVAMLPVGTPAEFPPRQDRRSIASLVTRERFSAGDPGPMTTDAPLSVRCRGETWKARHSANG